MTGAEFLAYVKRKFIRTDKDTEIYEATTDVIADMRIRFLAEKYKEEAYITGIATLGEYRIAVPADFGHMIGNITLVDTDSDTSYRPLEKISKQKYDELYHSRLLASTSNMHTGQPLHFCVYGDQIFLGPVPDKVTYKYQINYTTEGFVAVAAATDPVPFCGNYRNTVRSGVLAELHDGMENYEESNFWRVLYNDGINKIIENDNSNTSDREQIQYNGI